MSANPYAPPPASPPATPAGTPPPGAAVFAPCPLCQCPYAKRITWTLWGGALGPWMLTHVRCTNCGNAYNGKTGKLNTLNIAIHLLVSVVLGIIAGLVIALAPLFM